MLSLPIAPWTKSRDPYTATEPNPAPTSVLDQTRGGPPAGHCLRRPVSLDRPDRSGMPLQAPMNAGPQMHYVLQRAFDAVDNWIRTGTPPPTADRLAVDGDTLSRDDAGIGRGGGAGVGSGAGGGLGPGRGGNLGGGNMGIGGGGSVEPMTASLKPTILYREKAKYTEEARQNKVQGSVVLQVVFHANGTITDIRVVRGLPDGLTEKAIEAAKRIRFQPAVRAGVAVSVRGTLDYSFNLY